MMKVSRHTLVLFELAPPLVLSTRHCILCELPAQALFELEKAPFLTERLISPIQPYQEEIGQDGQGHRVYDTLRLFGDLHLPQVQNRIRSNGCFTSFRVICGSGWQFSVRPTCPDVC